MSKMTFTNTKTGPIGTDPMGRLHQKLEPCEACRNLISKKARHCPFCGHPNAFSRGLSFYIFYPVLFVICFIFIILGLRNDSIPLLLTGMFLFLVPHLMRH